MKKIIIYILLILNSLYIHGQIAHYNQFPAKMPTHILDENLTDISFAFSMRIIESNYNGPLIRLRRSNDNAEMDFYCADNDIVNIDTINNWRTGANVYVVIWYDQSGLNRNATQTTTNRQPRFFTDITMPYFQGDGNNDYLVIDTPNGIQDVTNNGDQGTVLSIMKASKKNQHSFGVLTGSNRWSAHANWGNNNLYFDPGVCCNNPRNFNNSSNSNTWASYTFIKTNTNVIIRAQGTERINGTHTKNRCTRTEDFAIGWATGNGQNNYATTGFMELIMYKTNISSAQYEEIEDNQIIFWNL